MLHVDSGEYRQLATRLPEVGAKVERRMRREIRALAKPLGDETLQAIGNAMPRRGGLSGRILAQGRVGLSFLGGGQSIMMQLRNSGGMFMSQFEQGSIRHPIWKTGRWASQTVPAGKGSEAFVQGSDELRSKLIDTVANTIKGAL